MKKNNFLKFVGIFEIIIFSLLLLSGVFSLAMALFQKFQVNVILDFINNKVYFLEEFYLYIINFFDTIYLSLELDKLQFITKIVDYLDIIYTSIFLLLATLGFIFAIVTTRASNGKAKGKGGIITGDIIYFLLAGAFTAFAVYFFITAKEIEAIVTPLAEIEFAKGGFTYDPLLNKIVIYALAGVTLFIFVFQLIGIFTAKKGAKAEKAQKASKANMGSYNPKQKPKEEQPLTSNQTAEYMKYQDSKSANPYINGNAKLSEDDLFGDLKPKPKEPEEVKKDEKPMVNPYKSAAPQPVQNNPFASSYAKPVQPTNTYNQTNVYGYNNPPMQNQYNNFNRPMPYNQNNNQPQQPAPTNINLTINPVAAVPGTTPQTVQLVQTPAATIQAVANPASVTTSEVKLENKPEANSQGVISASKPTATKPVAKTADEAFKAKPKAPTQALAKPKQPEMNLTDKLKELSALRQSGAISDDEYKALKQKAFQKFLKS